MKRENKEKKKAFNWHRLLMVSKVQLSRARRSLSYQLAMCSMRTEWSYKVKIN